MAVQTNIEKTIPALYKRNTLNTAMFAFVRGARCTLHTLTVKDAILMFMTDYGLEEDDDYNSSSAEATYYRMQQELLETKTKLNTSKNG